MIGPALKNGIPIVSFKAFASLLRAMMLPSLLESITTGRPSSRG
jgi:hypothetical protein